MRFRSINLFTCMFRNELQSSIKVKTDAFPPSGRTDLWTVRNGSSYIFGLARHGYKLFSTWNSCAGRMCVMDWSLTCQFLCSWRWKSSYWQPLATTESTCSVVSHSFCQHSLATARWAIHEHSSRWVNTNLRTTAESEWTNKTATHPLVFHKHLNAHANLFIELKMCERELHGFPHFLFLDVHSSDVCVHHIWLLI